MDSLSYARSGVDLTRAHEVKRRIAHLVQETFNANVLRPLGLFGGFFAAPGSDGRLVLVATVDSVGTKVLIAKTLGQHEGIGIDLVHHSANDLLACGAEPLFFLDYFATSELDNAVLEALVRGMTRACRELGCALIGGETAQLPGVYYPGTYDLAGCMVGVVPQDRIIDGSQIRAGDSVLGLPSTGLHTNGYSLARASLGLSGDPNHDRKILDERPDWASKTLGQLILEPHRCYVPLLRPWLKEPGLHGLAHITGGGLVENIARIVPPGLCVTLRAETWKIPPLFQEIQQRGNISTVEMFRVFNMGIGFVVIGRPAFVHELQRSLNEGWIIGEVEEALSPRVRLQYGSSARDVLIHD